MEEDEKVLAAEKNNFAPEEKQQPSKWNNFWRKQMVSLKRKPQRIGFWLFALTGVYYLFVLGQFSQAIDKVGGEINWVGLMVFVNVLFSILAIVLYLYSFPKLKKFGSKSVKQVEFAKGIRVNFNIVMIVLLIIFTAVMIICDGFYYARMNARYDASYGEMWDLIYTTMKLSIAHIVLISVSLICGCMTYWFGKWFVKVDTSVKVETSAENMGQIDLVEDE